MSDGTTNEPSPFKVTFRGGGGAGGTVPPHTSPAKVDGFASQLEEKWSLPLRLYEAVVPRLKEGAAYTEVNESRRRMTAEAKSVKVLNKIRS